MGYLFVCKHTSSIPGKTPNKTYFVSLLASFANSCGVFFPSVKFMGCATKSQSMMKLNDYIVKTVSASHTDEIEFTGKINMFCHKMVLGREANVIDGKSTGVQKEDGSAVTIEDLFGTSNVALYSGTYGLWIPHEKILSRVKYGYFPRMSAGQVMKSGEFVSRAVTAAGS